MRGTNGPMEVITRAEFDDSMKDVLTKTDFELRLADTKSELVSAMKLAVKESIDDLKIDLLAEVAEKVKRSHSVLELGAVKSRELTDVKNEMLATMRRNIGEAIEPLKTDLAAVKADVADLKSEVGGLKTEVGGLKTEIGGLKADMEMRFLKVGARLDAMQHEIKTVVTDGYLGLDEKLTRFTAEVLDVQKQHQRMLDRHDAELYKLRQSGVLN
jgi:hypothetical protein